MKLESSWEHEVMYVAKHRLDWIQTTIDHCKRLDLMGDRYVQVEKGGWVKDV